jgi:2-polyprenyl-3-methyl-5-hydroxy-6-metoxy-1,4-benzoquinol methylase
MAFGPEKRECPICTGTQLRADFTRELGGVTLHWVGCRRCGFTFMNPPIVPENMRAYHNSDAYWQNGAYAHYLEGEDVRVLNARRRMARIARHMPAAPATGRWLDIGCATGSFSVVARERGYTVIGLDPAAKMTRFGCDRYRLDLRPLTIEEFRADASSFDVVSLWGTDSHFYDVRESWSKIVSLIKPGGHLVFNYQDYDHWIRLLFPAIKQSVNAYYNFTRSSLHRFLPQLGMTIVSEQMEWQLTQLYRLTRTIRFGERLFSRWDACSSRFQLRPTTPWSHENRASHQSRSRSSFDKVDTSTYSAADRHFVTMSTKLFTSRLAPPISAPSTSGSAMSALMLSGFTLPP